MRAGLRVFFECWVELRWCEQNQMRSVAKGGCGWVRGQRVEEVGVRAKISGLDGAGPKEG